MFSLLPTSFLVWSLLVLTSFLIPLIITLPASPPSLFPPSRFACCEFRWSAQWLWPNASQQNSCPYNVRLHTRCSAPHRNSFFSIGCGPSLSFRTHSSESFQSWQYFALRRESGYGSYADIIILYRQKYWDTCPLHPEEAKKQYHDTSTLLERLSVREKLFQSFFSLPPGELDGLYGQIFQETSCMKCSVPLHNQWSSLFWTAQPIKTTYTVWHQYWFRDEINWALKICLVTGMIGFVVLFFFFFVESISIWFNSFCV